MVTDLSYDLHIHSCLSPCGDDDMTPANIAGMAHIKGLDVAALTDHNTCKNCPAFFEACEYYGVVPVAGMELTTAEDIHMIALFPELSSAMNFSAEIEKHMFRIKNDPDIFGRQLILDCEDRIIGEEENLLVNATDLDVDSAVNLCKSLGGIMYPAHIDRNSNGMAAILGGIPKEYGFSAFEVRDREKADECIEKYGLEKCIRLSCSDAHHLWDINEAENFISLDIEDRCATSVRRSLMEVLSK